MSVCHAGKVMTVSPSAGEAVVAPSAAEAVVAAGVGKGMMVWVCGAAALVEAVALSACDCESDIWMLSVGIRQDEVRLRTKIADLLAYILLDRPRGEGGHKGLVTGVC